MKPTVGYEGMKTVKHFMFGLLSLVVLSSVAGWVGAETIAFSDGVFDDTDWTASILYDGTGSVVPDYAGSFQVQQVDIEGNPDEYRELEHTWYGRINNDPDTGGFTTGHLRAGAVYNPSTQGPIASIGCSFDLKLIAWGSSQGMNYRLLLVQDGYVFITLGAYSAQVGDYPPGMWYSFGFTDLTADKFSLHTGPGPSIPDFSSNGGPIQFGYAANNGRSFPGFTSTTAGIDNWSVIVISTEPPVTEIEIDIKPGSDKNRVNLDSNGNVPVAILSHDGFDATMIDPLSITLSGASVKLKGKGTPMASTEDVNGDGLQDLVVHILTQELELTPEDTEAVLEAETFDGTRIQGTDSVQIVP